MGERLRTLFGKNRFTLLLALLLSACGGSGGSDDGSPPADDEAHFWDTPTPDFSADPNRPTITMIGNQTILLNIGDTYVDAGANATDLQDGDLSGEIETNNKVNTAIAGDYLVRYSVTDSDGRQAIEAVRIVRVFDAEPVSQTRRPIGKTASHLGYWEHLPTTYGDDPAETFPLLIFHHGAGQNADQQPDPTPESALDNIIDAGGPSTLIRDGDWDNSRPFIVLSPQRGEMGNVDIKRIKAFVDYAVSVYAVDTARIYMTGWSQGGYVTFLYASTYPSKLAAGAPIAGGYFGGFPSNFCRTKAVPIWAFHGSADGAVSPNASINAIDRINDCSPPVPARLTIYPGAGHPVHTRTYNLSGMNTGDPDYDEYDQSIYDWFLSYDLLSR